MSCRVLLCLAAALFAAVPSAGSEGEIGRAADLKRKVEEFGMTVATSTPEELGQLIAKEATDIRDLVHKLGLKQQ